MRAFGTFVLAFVLSVAIGGAVQQALMLYALRAHEPLGALIPFAGMVLIVSIVFGIAVRQATALNRTAAWLGSLLVAAGAALLIVGLRDYSPGIGGNIFFELAVLIDVGFLLPAAVAVAIHWRLWRRPVA